MKIPSFFMGKIIVTLFLFADIPSGMKPSVTMSSVLLRHPSSTLNSRKVPKMPCFCGFYGVGSNEPIDEPSGFKRRGKIKLYQRRSYYAQLDHANAQLSDNNWQIELLTEQIRIMNQRFFGRKSETSVSEIDGQLSLFDSFNEVEYLKQDPSKEPEITEVIIPSYHRKKSVGKRDADLSGLFVSSNTHFPMRNWPTGFLTATRNFRQKFINVSTSFRKHLSWMSITFMSMPQKAMTELS